MKTVTGCSIEIAKTCSIEFAQQFKAIIEKNPSFMNFQVTICPFQGMWVVNAETLYTSSKQKAQEMLNALMFAALTA